MKPVEYTFGPWELGAGDLGSTEWGLIAKGYGHDFYCKWDGCIDMRDRSPDGSEPDIFHICDLNKFIQELQELQVKLKSHWQGNYPKDR